MEQPCYEILILCMMKHRYNIAVSTLFAVTLLSAPMSFALAERGSSQSLAQVTLSTSGKGSFCSEIDGLASQALSSITDLEKKYNKKSEERMKEVCNVRTMQEQSEAERRGQSADMRAKALAELTAKAKTSKEKAALKKFAQDLDVALALRQKQVDESNAILRKQVDKMLSDRKAALSAATTSLKAAVDASVKKAKASCSNKASGNTVKDEFKDNLKKARISFEAAVQKIASTTPDSAIKTRNDAMLSAHKAFNKTLESKLSDLKKAAPTL